MAIDCTKVLVPQKSYLEINIGSGYKTRPKFGVLLNCSPLPWPILFNSCTEGRLLLCRPLLFWCSHGSILLSTLLSFSDLLASIFEKNNSLLLPPVFFTHTPHHFTLKSEIHQQQMKTV